MEHTSKCDQYCMVTVKRDALCNVCDALCVSVPVELTSCSCNLQSSNVINCRSIEMLLWAEGGSGQLANWQQQCSWMPACCTSSLPDSCQCYADRVPLRFPVQASERRMRRLEKQLATLSAALGPAAADALESVETSSAASGAGMQTYNSSGQRQQCFQSGVN